MAKKKRTDEFRIMAPPETTVRFNTIQSISIDDGCEWCFQFDDDEPIVFATSAKSKDSYIQFKLTNTNNSNIDFFDRNKTKKFKLFAREKK
jgi:hypothetical protein